MVYKVDLYGSSMWVPRSVDGVFFTRVVMRCPYKRPGKLFQFTNWKDPPCFENGKTHYFDWAMASIVMLVYPGKLTKNYGKIHHFIPF